MESQARLNAEPAVAVITRTKNRSVLLRRAVQSVRSQSFRDYRHFIVNDGGDRVSVDAVVDEFNDDARRISVIHVPESVGMEAASNIGIKASESRYIVIHDDDDSWQSTFLEESVNFLENEKTVAGVVVGCYQIEERIDGEDVRILRARPYAHRLRGVWLRDICTENQFAPIAFLYRRSVTKEIGLYSEDMPVLGDWDFNLRLASKFRIGYLGMRLANYHHRTGGGILSNSISAGANMHAEYRQRMIDRYLRADMQTGRVGLGLVMAFSDQIRGVGSGEFANRIRRTVVGLAPVRYVLDLRYRRHAEMIQNRFHRR